MDDYNVFRIPKKSGGWRTIEAPSEELKEKQRADLPWLKGIFKTSIAAHGFIDGRSIVTAAREHKAPQCLLCFDIKDFFPSITMDRFVQYRMLKRARRQRLRGRTVMTDYELERLKKHFYDFSDDKGPRLPQGAPASPYLSNIYMRSFDSRMLKVARIYGLTYTRYADDIQLSFSRYAEIDFEFPPKDRMIARLWSAKKIAARMLGGIGLTINEKKTRLKQPCSRMAICGLVVNPCAGQSVRIPRRWRRRLRAALHQQGEHPDARTKGMQAYAHMVEKQRAIA
jgi:hypothetical protein